MSNITEATKEDWEDFWNELESSEEENFEKHGKKWMKLNHLHRKQNNGTIKIS